MYVCMYVCMCIFGCMYTCMYACLCMYEVDAYLLPRSFSLPPLCLSSSLAQYKDARRCLDLLSHSRAEEQMWAVHAPRSGLCPSSWLNAVETCNQAMCPFQCGALSPTDASESIRLSTSQVGVRYKLLRAGRRHTMKPRSFSTSWSPFWWNSCRGG
jgi:hypothetical protein